MSKKPAEPEQCLTPVCDKPAAWKGICRSCYAQALKLIEKGETTWEELEDLKLIESKPRLLETALIEARRKAKIADPAEEK